MRKKRISNSILKAIKETSVDCSVYSTATHEKVSHVIHLEILSWTTLIHLLEVHHYGSQILHLLKNNLLERLMFFKSYFKFGVIAVNVGPPSW